MSAGVDHNIVMFFLKKNIMFMHAIMQQKGLASGNSYFPCDCGGSPNTPDNPHCPSDFVISFGRNGDAECHFGPVIPIKGAGT
jgi:hypothetical protein